LNTPVTTLDQGNSDQDAVAAGWDETRRVLESAELFWISTVRADGRPHVTPVVAVWSDDAIHFHTVVVEGDAVQVTNEDTLKRLAEAWATKWDGRWRLSTRDGGFRNLNMNDFPSLVFTVTPAKVFAHAKGDPFGGSTAGNCTSTASA
jgi:hypothetical protein